MTDQSSDVTKVYGQPASLGDMLAKLTAEEQTNGPTLINVLLLTYHDYSSIKEIMEWLQRRYLASVAESTGNIADSEREAEIQMARRLRIVNFVRVWIQNHFHDFEDLGCFDLLNSFIGLLQVTGMSKASDTLRSILHRKSDELKATRVETSKTPETLAQKKERTPSAASGKGWMLLGRKNTAKDDTPYDSPILLWDEGEIARQLCLIDFDLMKTIRSRELLGAMWTKPDVRLKKASGVCALIDHFNRIASWVGTEILSAPEKSRQKVARHFAKVVKELVRLNDYCSSFAITAQLTDSTITRFNYLQDMSSSNQKSFDQLKALLHPGNRELRPLLRKLVPPYIPYPGMYLNDLALMDEGNPSRIDGLINFRKYILLANSIDEFLRCQSAAFPFEAKPEIQEYIRQCPALTSEQLTDLSLRILPLKNVDIGAFNASARTSDSDRSQRAPSASPNSGASPLTASTAALPGSPSVGSPSVSPSSSAVVAPTPEKPIPAFTPVAPSSPAPSRSPKPTDEQPPPPPPRQLEDNGSLIRAGANEVAQLQLQLKEREEQLAKAMADLDKEREKVKRLASALRATQQSLQAAQTTLNAATEP